MVQAHLFRPHVVARWNDATTGCSPSENAGEGVHTSAHGNGATPESATPGPLSGGPPPPPWFPHINELPPEEPGWWKWFKRAFWSVLFVSLGHLFGDTLSRLAHELPWVQDIFEKWRLLWSMAWSILPYACS